MKVIHSNAEQTNKSGKAHKRLTIAELKKCKGFENYSDEQAEETINSLEKLSILFYQLFMEQKQREEKLALLNQHEQYEEYNRNAA